MPASLDPETSARNVGLRYVQSDEPGISRLRCGRGFSYRAAGGTRITDPETLRRIRSLAIPPGWTKVWICPDARGHIQATARDARGRKQYRYHSRWREVRDNDKFDHLVEFAHGLPTLRSRVGSDLGRRGLPRRKVIALAVRLLDSTLIRVGNEEYARQNSSFGLTTLRRRHVSVQQSTVVLRFRGKSGKQRRLQLSDSRLARIVRRCQELPGQKLFQYEDGGRVRDLDSSDVNEYLRAVTGREVSSRDFRTWGATVSAAISLWKEGPGATVAERKRQVAAAVGRAAVCLGNTPAVCRRSYIHPAVIESHLDGSLSLHPSRAKLRAKASHGTAADRHSRARDVGPGLDDSERMVLAFLERRLERLDGDRVSQTLRLCA